MGKRGRTRGQVPTKQSRVAAPPPRGKLDPVRRTLTGYLVGALGLAIVTLLGIIVLGGTLGPFIVLAVVAIGAGLLHRRASGRLAGAELRHEDRMIQTMAGGMLFLCVVLAAASAVVAAVV